MNSKTMDKGFLKYLNQSTSSLSQRCSPSFESIIRKVPKVEEDAESHVEDGDDDGKLHLVAVEEDDLVLCDNPDRIHAKRVRVATVVTARPIRHVRAIDAIGRQHVVLVSALAEEVFIRVIDAPGGAEDVEGLGEDVVVDHARVDTEQAHEKDDVASSKDDAKHLVLDFLQGFFLDAKVSREDGDKETMAGVAEHDGEQEREGDDSVQARIDLPVVSHAVSVDKHLEAVSELVCPDESRRHLVRGHGSHNRSESTLGSFLLIN